MTVELPIVRIIDVTFGRVEIEEDVILAAYAEILTRRLQKQLSDFQWRGLDFD